MPQSALGVLLQNLRQERRNSLRDVAQLAGTDHAYIYRLETGIAELPSDEILSRLIKALNVEKREAEMLRFLTEHPDTDPGLVEFAIKDKSVTLDEFASVAGAVFRDQGKPDYPKLLQSVRRILAVEE